MFFLFGSGGSDDEEGETKKKRARRDGVFTKAYKEPVKLKSAVGPGRPKSRPKSTASNRSADVGNGTSVNEVIVL